MNFLNREEALKKHNSHKYKAVTWKLAIFVGSSNVANTIVENYEFVDLLEALDPRYPVPSRTARSKEFN